MVKIYEVGGSIRDQLLGLPYKDKDYAVEASSWEEMRDYIHSISTKVFLEKPEFFTIRAMVEGEPRDYVLCRKESSYGDGRHPDKVEPGTILEDLSRRDFQSGAIARDTETGEIIDPFNGRDDIEKRILRCVGNPKDRFEEDSLRFIRAIRFIITKNFKPDISIYREFQNLYWASKLSSISRERIREELEKCFSYDTFCTMKYLSSNVDNKIVSTIFGDDIWLKPTSERRK